jgi:hypothetical protein
MVPMASQDSVLDRAPMQRKAQVRTTVIQREHAALVVHDDERPVRPPLRRSFSFRAALGADKRG